MKAAIILTIVFVGVFSFINGFLKSTNQAEEEELSKVCEAVNYRLVTIRGHHHCLPFMPEQEGE